MDFQLKTSTLGISIENDGGWTLWDLTRDERLLIVPAAPICAPVFSETATPPRLQGINIAQNLVEWRYEISGCRDFSVRLAVENERLVLSSRFTPHTQLSLAWLEVLPSGTIFNLYDVVNFRNRHYSPHTWPELLLGGAGCQTTTYSNDWQFAPHPSLLTFRKNRRHLLIGALDLSASFGLHFGSKEHRASEFFLDFGGETDALKLEANIEWVSPRFVLLDNETDDVHETIALYSQELTERGLIADPKQKTRFDWHREPLYFSWIDQSYRADTTPVASLEAQAKAMGDADHVLLRVMTADFVREIAATIRREKLPIRTFVLDDGWQVARGQWEPHPVRFPDMRGLVDELHEQGFKVAFWWSWAEILDSAELDDETLLKNADGTPWINPHGSRVRDYSHPATQQYLRDLFRTLFSSEAGCYDFDAVKTDFLADKVHAGMPISDESWRGEENYMLHLTRFFFEEMRRHKSDACHIGCAGHPYLAEFIDINRTYDVFSTDAREHLSRARMLEVTSVGVPIAFDSHNFVEGMDDYFALAAQAGHSVQISNVLGQKRDEFSAWEASDKAFYDLLRRGLSAQK